MTRNQVLAGEYGISFGEELSGANGQVNVIVVLILVLVIYSDAHMHACTWEVSVLTWTLLLLAWCDHLWYCYFPINQRVSVLCVFV